MTVVSYRPFLNWTAQHSYVSSLISKDRIKDTLEIKDGDKVEIEFLEAKGEIKPAGKKLYERLKFGKGQKKVQQN